MLLPANVIRMEKPSARNANDQDDQELLAAIKALSPDRRAAIGELAFAWGGNSSPAERLRAERPYLMQAFKRAIAESQTDLDTRGLTRHNLRAINTVR